jgi:hypothetical protein
VPLRAPGGFRFTARARAPTLSFRLCGPPDLADDDDTEGACGAAVASQYVLTRTEVT